MVAGGESVVDGQGQTDVQWTSKQQQPRFSYLGCRHNGLRLFVPLLPHLVRGDLLCLFDRIHARHLKHTRGEDGVTMVRG